MIGLWYPWARAWVAWERAVTGGWACPVLTGYCRAIERAYGNTLPGSTDARADARLGVVISPRFRPRPDDPPPPIDDLVRVASSSPCQKSKRGAVLLRYSAGAPEYVFRSSNVPLRGGDGPGWTPGTCDGSEACRSDCASICTHAEEAVVIDAGNLAAGADVFHLKVVDGRPVATPTPSCVTCSRLMLRAGVRAVWLLCDDGWFRWTAAEFHAATLANLELHRP